VELLRPPVAWVRALHGHGGRHCRQSFIHTCPLKRRKLTGLARQLLNRRNEMHHHLVFLPLFVVIVTVNVKITISKR
jgi:hypothetical protein